METTAQQPADVVIRPATIWGDAHRFRQNKIVDGVWARGGRMFDLPPHYLDTTADMLTRSRPLLPLALGRVWDELNAFPR